MSSIVALFREQCLAEEAITLDQRQLRSILRTVAWANDPADSAYSTPRPGEDFKDGAGELFAGRLLCNQDPDEGGFESGVLDLYDGDDLPEGDADYHKYLESPGETQSVSPQAFDLDPSSPPAEIDSKRIVSLTLTPGDRLRATFSWDGCAVGALGVAPTGPAVDFDLFLYSASGSEYVWASQSLDDNNEGFDYTVQAGEGGTYDVYVAWDKSTPGCDGTQFEPYAFSYQKI